jgi:hypothetical protein
MPRISAVRQQRLQDMQKPEGTGYVIQSPVGGLNTRDALASMPETDAVVLDNWFCQPTWVETRGGTNNGNGSLLSPSGVTGVPGALMAYNPISGPDELYVAVSYATGATVTGIYGALAGGGQANSLKLATNFANFDYVQMGTGSAEVLVGVNGGDNPFIYDGAVWWVISATSSPYAWTGGPSGSYSINSFNQVVLYKQRLWFVVAGTMNVYYLPQDVFAGALTLLPMAPNFDRGGFIQAMITVSIDNAAGLNDYIAFISNYGEVVVYQGYDPSSVSTWSEAAHFFIGKPIGTGRRAWQKVGSDAIIICTDGLVPLSKALVTDRSQSQIAVTDKIRYSFNQAAQQYGGNNWQVLLYPPGTKIIVNVVTGAGTSYQYVQNTISGAWSTFGKLNNPWNALCFEIANNQLYYAAAGVVKACDIAGAADDSNAFVATAQAAWTYMGVQGQLKQWTMCRPLFVVSGNWTGITITFNVDFGTGGTAFAIGNAYAGGGPTAYQPWVGLNGEGFNAGLTISVNSQGVPFQWQNTRFIFKTGTQFYG